MTDLRTQLPAFEAAARRILRPRRRLTLVPVRRPALCHPTREHFSRGLCRGCYEHHRWNGTLADFPRANLPTDDFAADYALLRSEGYTRAQCAERLGMRRGTVDKAYGRAVAAGLLTPDRRTA
jgi:hypothetical protein